LHAYDSNQGLNCGSSGDQVDFLNFAKAVYCEREQNLQLKEEPVQAPNARSRNHYWTVLPRIKSGIQRNQRNQGKVTLAIKEHPIAGY